MNEHIKKGIETYDANGYWHYQNGVYFVEDGWAPNGTELTFEDSEGEMTPVEVIDRLASLEAERDRAQAMVERLIEAWSEKIAPRSCMYLEQEASIRKFYALVAEWRSREVRE